ncbi:MAG: hypothetical protein ACK5PT_00845, partial [Cereibacter sp.]
QRCAGSPCQTLSPGQSGQPDPQFSTSLETKQRSPAFATPALAFRELRHPATTGYRYRDIQDTDRING